MKRKLLGFPLMLFWGVISFAIITESCHDSEPFTCQTYMTVGNKSGADIYVGGVGVKPTQENLCANGGSKQWWKNYELPDGVTKCGDIEGIGEMCEITVLNSSGAQIFFGYFYTQGTMTSYFTWDGKTMKIGQ